MADPYKFLTALDLNGNQLLNALFQMLAAAPGSPQAGRFYLDTTSSPWSLRFYDGSDWVTIGPVVSVNGKAGIVTLTQDDIGNGTIYKQTHNDLTDALVLLINGALQKSGGTMTGAIAMGGYGITGLAAPTNNSDASTKKYVDDAISGLGAVFDFKGEVATVNDLPLSGNKKGDVYQITADGSEYYWAITASSGSASDWHYLGKVIDLSGYATLESPAFTGTPTAPTPTAGDDSTKIATTAFVKAAVDAAKPKTATGTISTSATSATVNFAGTLLGAYATQGGSMVLLDIAPSSNSVTFTVAAAPSRAVTCVVVYA